MTDLALGIAIGAAAVFAGIMLSDTVLGTGPFTTWLKSRKNGWL